MVAQDEPELKGKTRLVLWGEEETWRWRVRMTLQMGQRASITRWAPLLTLLLALMWVRILLSFQPGETRKVGGYGRAAPYNDFGLDF